eukprot:COSAG05_NODE_742_length_7592_cov_2.844922_6_plen_420_part_00
MFVYHARFGEGKLREYKGSGVVVDFPLSQRKTLHSHDECWIAPPLTLRGSVEEGQAATVTNNCPLASARDVSTWLAKQAERECSFYAGQFLQLGVTGARLADVTDEQLCDELCVVCVAHRRSLLRLCRSLDGFLGRYVLKDGPPVYVSAQTCVIRATDKGADDGIPSQSSLPKHRGQASPLGDRSTRALLPSRRRHVVLKCLRSAAAFDNELRARQRLPPAVAVPVLAAYAPAKYIAPNDLAKQELIVTTVALASDAASFDPRLLGQHVLALPCADHIVGDVLRSGATPEATRPCRQQLHALARLLRECELAGVVHGDVNWDNMATHHGKMSLLNFDRSSATGQPLLTGTQTDGCTGGLCPPELAASTLPLHLILLVLLLHLLASAGRTCLIKRVKHMEKELPSRRPEILAAESESEEL